MGIISILLLQNMTHFVSKKDRIAGATFIEALAVTAVIGVVLAAMGSTFTVGLKSYVGEYTSEATQLEVQRAYSELHYFGSKSTRFDITGGLDGTQGDSVTFYGADGSTSTFMFSYIDMYDGSRRGELSIVTPWGQQYWYGVNVLADGWPFTVSNGGCSFIFHVESAGGPVSMFGLVHPGLVL